MLHEHICVRSSAGAVGPRYTRSQLHHVWNARCRGRCPQHRIGLHHPGTAPSHGLEIKHEQAEEMDVDFHIRHGRQVSLTVKFCRRGRSNPSAHISTVHSSSRLCARPTWVKSGQPPTRPGTTCLLRSSPSPSSWLVSLPHRSPRTGRSFATSSLGTKRTHKIVYAWLWILRQEWFSRFSRRAVVQQLQDTNQGVDRDRNRGRFERDQRDQGH